METKFRAYLKATNEMVEVNSITFTASGGMHIVPKPYDASNSIPIGESLGVETGNVLVQYVGLTDKNGVEAYAGDIYMEDGLLWVLCQDDLGVWTEMLPDRNQWTRDFTPEIWAKECEIIGNIHQHKHLLS